MEIPGCVNGWPTSFIAEYNPDLVFAGLGDDAMWLPILTRRENGTKNFIDAANHNQ
jgi:hypothetical protein